MFFILSKIFSFVLNPITWVVFFAAWSLYAKSAKLKRRLAIVSFVILLFFTNGFISSKVLGWTEIKGLGKQELASHYDVGILLGGLTDVQSDTNKISFNQNGDRLFQTLDLYYSGIIDKILVTTGSGLIQLPKFKEADLIKTYMLRIGVPEEDIIIENKSSNTYENAAFSTKLLKEIYSDFDERTFVLITSASHLRRGVACFKKQGVEVAPYATNKIISEDKQFVFNKNWILPDPYALKRWDIITHELFGMLIYKIKGYV